MAAHYSVAFSISEWYLSIHVSYTFLIPYIYLCDVHISRICNISEEGQDGFGMYLTILSIFFFVIYFDYSLYFVGVEYVYVCFHFFMLKVCNSSTFEASFHFIRYVWGFSQCPYLYLVFGVFCFYVVEHSQQCMLLFFPSTKRFPVLISFFFCSGWGQSGRHNFFYNESSW